MAIRTANVGCIIIIGLAASHCGPNALPIGGPEEGGASGSTVSGAQNVGGQSAAGPLESVDAGEPTGIGAVCPPTTVGGKTLSSFGDGLGRLDIDGKPFYFLVLAGPCDTDAGTCQFEPPAGGEVWPPPLDTDGGSNFFSLPSDLVPGCDSYALHVRKIDVANILSLSSYLGPAPWVDLSAYQGLALIVAGKANGIELNVGSPCWPNHEVARVAEACTYYYGRTFGAETTWTEVRIPWAELRGGGFGYDPTLVNPADVPPVPPLLDSQHVASLGFFVRGEDAELWISAIGVY